VVFYIFSFISTIFLLDLGTVLTVWYFSFYFYDFSIRLRSCSDSVVFYIFPFISTIFLLDLGTVCCDSGIFPFISRIFLSDLGTACYDSVVFFLLFLRFFYYIYELF
jgi:hypothetical protein